MSNSRENSSPFTTPVVLSRNLLVPISALFVAGGVMVGAWKTGSAYDESIKDSIAEEVGKVQEQINKIKEETYTRFVSKELYGARMDEVMRRLESLERKLDDIRDRQPK